MADFIITARIAKALLTASALAVGASPALSAECSKIPIAPPASQIKVHYVPNAHMAKACGLDLGPGVGVGNCAGQIKGHPGVWQIYISASLNEEQRADTLAYEMTHLTDDFCSDWQR